MRVQHFIPVTSFGGFVQNLKNHSPPAKTRWNSLLKINLIFIILISTIFIYNNIFRIWSHLVQIELLKVSKLTRGKHICNRRNTVQYCLYFLGEIRTKIKIKTLTNVLNDRKFEGVLISNVSLRITIKLVYTNEI